MTTTNRYFYATCILSAGLSFAFLTWLSGCDRSGHVEWISPYKEVNWEHVIRAKGQFHTHSTCSDGYLSPDGVVDLYQQLGYDILAITDHWKTTWPWQEFSSFQASDRTQRRLEEGDLEGLSYEEVFVFEDRNPEETGMIAIMGSEPSHRGPRTHHMVSLFSDVNGDGMEYEELLAAVGDAGGLISFAHPARIVERENNTLEDYLYYFDTYPWIYGIDIFTRATFNQPERWPINKELVAGILNHYGNPADEDWRPVWMTSVDDLHDPRWANRALQIQLINERTEQEAYRSLKEGTFFWIAQSADRETPFIESIEFGRSDIRVRGRGYDQVLWYSDNKVVHTGSRFDLHEHGSDALSYVYFIARTADFSIEEETGAMLGSQPFWILRNGF